MGWRANVYGASGDTRQNEMTSVLCARMNAVDAAKFGFRPVRGVIVKEQTRTPHQALRLGAFEILSADRQPEPIPGGTDDAGGPYFHLDFIDLVRPQFRDVVMRMIRVIRRRST